MVDAYLLILQGAADEAPGSVYNVASGQAVKMRDILKKLVASSPAAIAVEVDPGRVRSGPCSTYIGDASKLRRRFGWSPRIAVDQALASVLADQRARLATL